MTSKELMRSLIFAFLLLAVMGTSAVQALDVKQGRIGKHPDKMRLVLELSDNVKFRTFTLASPYRLVVDLPTFEWHAGDQVVRRTANVADLRRGKLTAEHSRIVLDMTKPMVIKKAFIIPARSGVPPRLVIDYRHTDRRTFRRHKSAIFGDLQIRPQQTKAQTTKQSAGGHNQQDKSQQADQVARLATAAGRKKPPVGRSPVKTPLIILDPGHGGHDPGAVAKSQDIVEKAIVLKFAHELKKRLVRSGDYRVKLTRNNDTFISLGERRRYAHDHKGDLFISLHADSIRDKNVRGASIYTLSEDASDKQTARLARQENKAGTIAGVDLSHESKDVSNILIDLAMRDTMNQSKFLANTIADKFRARSVKVLDTTHRYAAFAVLKSADIPSVLVELGFMSNPYEVQRLLRRSHRRKLAKALHSGIDAYFMRIAKFER